jgi:hypothetical protein
MENTKWGEESKIKNPATNVLATGFTGDRNEKPLLSLYLVITYKSTKKI